MRITIAQALATAAERLRAKQIDNARHDAQLLLQKVLARDLTFLIAHDREVLSESQSAEFDNFVRRRADGEPLQYITGAQEFYGLAFEVNENVLIPRPETELLVEAAIEILRARTEQTFCDVGTGSGCVAVAVAKNLPAAIGVCLDISLAALKVAARNAENNRVAERLKFIESDVFAALKNQKSKIKDQSSKTKNQKFSVIISNPPYIPATDAAVLQREVVGFEPHAALFGGADGLDIVRKLLKDATAFLTANGFLLFEIGFGQSSDVREIIDQNVWRLVEIRPDLQGIPRTVIVQLQ